MKAWRKINISHLWRISRIWTRPYSGTYTSRLTSGTGKRSGWGTAEGAFSKESGTAPRAVRE